MWRRSTLGQAQLKVILHGGEEILEAFGCTIEEALEKSLLKEIRKRASVKHPSVDFHLHRSCVSSSGDRCWWNLYVRANRTEASRHAFWQLRLNREHVNHLIGLKAAGHTILVDATAAVGQAAFTDVLSGAGSVDITAAVHQQVFPLTHVTCKTSTRMSAYWLKLQEGFDLSLSSVYTSYQAHLWAASSPGWSFCTESSVGCCYPGWSGLSNGWDGLNLWPLAACGPVWAAPPEKMDST